MNRTVVSGVAAFALFIGAGLAMTETTAEAGQCGGGLFSRLHAKKACGGGLFANHGGGLFKKKACGGGLLSRLRARHAAKGCGAPEPACCDPAPEPCCDPAPAPCCEPAPAPCCEPAPACGGCETASAAVPCCGGEVAAPAVAAPCCDGTVAAGAVVGGAVVGGTVVGAAASDAGFDLAPGETLVPGSVQTVDAGGSEGELTPPASASDAPAPAPAAEEAAPPAPTPDASTDA